VHENTIKVTKVTATGSEDNSLITKQKLVTETRMKKKKTG